MTCENCFKDNINVFEKITQEFISRRPMVIFLLNVVLNIKDLSDRYCFCKRTSSILLCLTCQFRIVYLNDEFDIYQNSLDMHFLVTFYHHLYKNLKRLLLETNSHLVCELVKKSIFIPVKTGLAGKLNVFIFQIV